MIDKNQQITDVGKIDKRFTWVQLTSDQYKHN